MNVSVLLEDLRARGVVLRPDGEQLRVSAPRGALTPELSEALKAHKSSILALLTRARGDLAADPPHADLPPIEAAPDRPSVQPLGIAQERLWFMDALTPGTNLLNLPGGFMIEGPLDTVALEQAINSIVARHEILRTEFRMSADGPVQAVLQKASVKLEVIDVVAETRADSEGWKAHVWRRASVPVARDRAPLLRTTLIRIAPERHALLVVASHLVWDGTSFDVFLSELRQAYAFEKGRGPAPQPPPVQYGDYVAWHTNLLAEGWQAESLEYWGKLLRNAPHALELPLDHPRPAQMSYRGWMHGFEVPESVSTQLRELAAGRRATLFMALLAGLDVVLSRYCAERDLIVGTPVAGRARPEIERSIGLFINTIALRTQVPQDATFSQVLEAVKASAVAAFEHEHTPFERVVDAVRPARDRSRTPLFQVMFGYRQVPKRLGILGEAALLPLRVHAGAAMADLTLWVEDDGRRLFCGLDFATDLFELETIKRIADALLGVWDEGSRAPDALLSELALPDSHRRALAELTHTERDYDQSRPLHRLFEDRVDETPERVAVVFEDRQVTYAELDARASALARRLRAEGVGPESLVGVCVERSIELVVTLMAVLKAGGAYVPLDPSLPVGRLAWILDDAGATVVVVTRTTASRIAPGHVAIIDIDRERKAISALDSARLEVEGEDGRQLAYLMYTSGSTGRPKGVLVEHRNVLAFLFGMKDVVDFDASGVWLAGTSVSFDISVLEIFGPLTHGMSVVLLGEQRLGDVAREEYSILSSIMRHGVTHFQCTPSQATVLLSNPAHTRALGRLRQLLVGGEKMTDGLCRHLLSVVRAASVLNMYGPTETTVWATCQELHSLVGAVPIGKPLANVRCYILDASRRPVPAGAVGELYIGGDLVARGYHRLPELTAERFVPDPFGPPESRMYRTGDRVRLGPTGALVYHGRTDDQIKIRGHRVEPAEIVQSLESHASVRTAAVVARTDAAGTARMTAFVVAADETNPPGVDALREHVVNRLPAYMVPARIVVLDALPQTPSGKVDRQELGKMADSASGPRQESAEPRDDLDRSLLGVWRDVLGIEDIGIDDDFFEVGGHSLLGVQILSRIFEEQGVLLSLGVLFEAPTVRALAAVVRREQASRDEHTQRGWSAVVPIQPKGSLPPFFCAAGRGGNPMNLRHIAWSMGSEQPFFGLQHRGVDGRMLPHASLADMAEEMADHIRQVQPGGPYYIGGFSGGGVVAMEVARALTRAGEEVALLVLLESANPARPSWTRGQRIKYHAEQLRRLGASHVSGIVRRRIDNVREAVRLGYARLRSPSDPYKYRNEMVNLAYLDAARHYKPEPYPGDVLLIRSKIRDTAVIDPDNGWGPVVKGHFEVVEVGGSHVSFVVPPHAADTARVLSEALASARANHSIAPPPLSTPTDGKTQVWAWTSDGGQP